MTDELLDRLSPEMVEQIRNELLFQINQNLKTILLQKQSRLNEQFRIASAISEVSKLKQFINNRPGWGSW